MLRCFSWESRRCLQIGDGLSYKRWNKIICVLKENSEMETLGHEIFAQNKEAFSPRAMQRWEGLAGESVNSHP